jgi:hypothetical protein
LYSVELQIENKKLLFFIVFFQGGNKS